MKTIIAYTLAIVTFALGHVAWTITMTDNPAAIGGYFHFAVFTFSPICFFYFGKIWGSIQQPETRRQKRYLMS